LRTLKIGTFNVNSIRARTDLIQKWLERRGNDLDIICFQEIKAVEEDFPYGVFEKYGFQCEVYGQKRVNGVATCSKIPLEDLRKGFGDSRWDEEKRIIAGKVEDLKIVNVYAPHGDLRGEEKFYHKLAWYKALVNFLEKHYSPEDRMIVVGDFNIARNDLDVFDPEMTKDGIGTMPEEREAFNEVLNWGLIDSFRHLYSEKKEFTWWDYIGGAIWKNEGMRIDYILCTKTLIKEVKDVEVDLWPRRRRTPTPSDHAPVTATLERS